jgi:endonuclease/exonuclease/phosphatase family metal-dependent hydrolase
VPELTIASFNTHYGLKALHDGCDPYDLLTALDTLGEPDVVVVQEVWRPDSSPAIVDDYALAHGYARHDLVLSRATILKRWPQVALGGEGTIGISVLTRLPATEVARPRVGPTYGDPVHERRVLHLEIAVDGTPIDLVAVHLSSRLPHAPPLQLRRLARVLPPPGRPGVVAGDCNFWGPPAAALLPGWTRAVRGRTWPAHRPHSQIDHIFVRGGIDVVEQSVLGEVGSDHRPVRVRLCVN